MQVGKPGCFNSDDGNAGSKEAFTVDNGRMRSRKERDARAFAWHQIVAQPRVIDCPHEGVVRTINSSRFEYLDVWFLTHVKERHFFTVAAVYRR